MPAQAGILFRDVAQSGSAPALGAGGPRFESWYPDIHYQGVTLRNVTPYFLVYSMVYIAAVFP